MKTTILKKISAVASSVAFLSVATMSSAFAQDMNSMHMTDTATQQNAGNQNQVQWFTDTISPLNNSGVHGYATLKLQGDQVTVNLTAWGLEPGKEHLQHIHGIVDGSNSTCPLPSANKDNDPTISLEEGLPFYGPILQSLTPFQTPTVNGAEAYHNTFTVNVADASKNILPLANREIVIHGMTVAANQDLNNTAAGYDVALPVACGHIVPVFRGFGAGNGAGTGFGGSMGSTIGIFGNGAGSRNNVNVQSSQTSNVSQNNNTRVTNDVRSNTSSGNNHSSFNTGGRTVLNSGDSMSSVTVLNNGNVNTLSH